MFKTSDYAVLDAPISPIDGRYKRQVSDLRNFFSTPALNRARIFVEIEWLIALCDGLPVSGFDTVRVPQVPGLPPLNDEQKSALRGIVAAFDSSGAARVEEIEQTTKHDVKAVEYYIKEQLKDLANQGIFTDDVYSKLFQTVHIFCTSEDINNLSYALIIKSATFECWLPKLQEFKALLLELAKKYKSLPMLAKTHGQPATPTTLGKELLIFVYRLERQIRKLNQQEFLGKINGATGTFGAHFVSVSNSNWPQFASWFVRERLDLDYNPLTPQIESHDWQAELYSTLSHAGRILHNFATDIWLYIMEEMFTQIPEKGATGSSTMPHKINPIKFENAEANLEISDAIFEKLSATLTTTRLQRDLTDSSTQRNVGVAFAHSVLAIDNLISGVKLLSVNERKLSSQLDENPAVLGEAVQSAMRAQGIYGQPNMEDPYERLKEFTRGKDITIESMHEFINAISFTEDMKQKLLQLTPATYIGLSEKIVEDVISQIESK